MTTTPEENSPALLLTKSQIWLEDAISAWAEIVFSGDETRADDRPDRGMHGMQFAEILALQAIAARLGELVVQMREREQR